MIILICGDRHWTNTKLIEDFIDVFVNSLGPLSVVFVEGEAPGADRACGNHCRRKGYSYHGVPAEWNKYGKAAGPIRNRRMLDMFRVNVVYAFHNDIDNSKGTRDMVEEARRRGIPAFVVTDK